ncbi:MAG: cell wall hydrolase [Pseudobutyrivibrio sp.]|nr:cell wall hydrolase [Pseudobutyrivibrio sp.]
MHRRLVGFVTAVIFSCLLTCEPAHAIEFEYESTDEMARLSYVADVQVEKEIIFPEEDVELIAKVVLGEAEGESELGKRLVASTILNRVDSDIWPNTVHDVCYQSGQFCCLHNGRCNRVKVTDSVRELVREEMASRTNYSVMYFSGGGYHNGTPMFKEGAHYFSGR